MVTSQERWDVLYGHLQGAHKRSCALGDLEAVRLYGDILTLMDELAKDVVP